MRATLTIFTELRYALAPINVNLDLEYNRGVAIGSILLLLFLDLAPYVIRETGEIAKSIEIRVRYEGLLKFINFRDCAEAD